MSEATDLQRVFCEDCGTPMIVSQAHKPSWGFYRDSGLPRTGWRADCPRRSRRWFASGHEPLEWDGTAWFRWSDYDL